MQPDLPETYYLDNVRTLFAHVADTYADILDRGLLDFLAAFDALGEDAQKLCIRLLNRRHDWFRRARLAYAEIGSLDAALDELAAAGFVELDGEIEPDTLLTLFNRAELLHTLDAAGAFAKLRRSELDAALLESDDLSWCAGLRAGERLVRVCCGERYLQCQMLFFGNLNQSMTDFVLNDLGLYRYEDYPIDAAHRPYRSQPEILQHWLLYRLETRFELDARDEPSALCALCDEIPGDIDPTAPAWRKSERLRYEIARQLERLGANDLALGYYRRCTLPPARERVARILDRRGDPRAAFESCLEIAAAPLDESELQFARAFALRLARRHALDIPPALAGDDDTHQPEVIDYALEAGDSVELAVAAELDARDRGEHCYYLENSLFTGVLGLLIWDAVFAPVAGAFYNPFQYRPSDFYEPDFCARRREWLDRTWKAIPGNDDMRRIVMARWDDKHGLMNPLVNWQALSREVIDLALERIEHAHWRAIFARILADLRHNRAGFPDLLHFPRGGGYCLVEVKGPGDSLQKNQQRWMAYFNRHGIPHRVARVTWRDG